MCIEFRPLERFHDIWHDVLQSVRLSFVKHLSARRGNDLFDIHRMVHRPQTCESSDDRQRQISVPYASSAGVLPSLGLPHCHFPYFPKLNRHPLTSAELHPSRLAALFPHLFAVNKIQLYEQCIGTCYRAKQYPFNLSDNSRINTVNQNKHSKSDRQKRRLQVSNRRCDWRCCLP